jgi:deoxyhypusine synthase
MALPLIAGYAFHKQAQASRQGKNWATILGQVPVTA